MDTMILMLVERGAFDMAMTMYKKFAHIVPESCADAIFEGLADRCVAVTSPAASVFRF